MKIQDQVVNLELSKQLKKLGVKQNNDLFYWHANVGNQYYLMRLTRTMIEYDPSRDISAFTVAELGEMLKKYKAFKNGDISELPKYDQILDVWVGFMAETSNTEADARAKMLIYLIENKLINI